MCYNLLSFSDVCNKNNIPICVSSRDIFVISIYVCKSVTILPDHKGTMHELKSIGFLHDWIKKASQHVKVPMFEGNNTSGNDFLYNIS